MVLGNKNQKTRPKVKFTSFFQGTLLLDLWVQQPLIFI